MNVVESMISSSLIPRCIHIFALLFCVFCKAQTKQRTVDILAPLSYTPLPLGSIAPRGWIKDQLQAQAAGLCGNQWLGENGHSYDSKWVGGTGVDDLHESYPYWLNGAIPMAVLLCHDELWKTILSQLDYIFTHGQEGFLGPSNNTWAHFRFCTALTLYIDATSDPRAVRAMWDHAIALLQTIKTKPFPFGSWQHSRWQELLEAYQWLLSSKHGPEATEQDRNAVWELMCLAREQGWDWPGWIESDESSPFINDTSVRGWFPNNTQDADLMAYNNKWRQVINSRSIHGVNVAQGIQSWHLLYRLTSNTTWLDRAKKGWEKLFRFHGQGTGVFSSDEELAGRLPNRGTETCVVVELMNSAANAFLVSGDVHFLDHLERIAYNALPAAFFNGTMWTMNYFQQINKFDAMDVDRQGQCETGSCVYCYGMVYECCVSNHVQGWPKFIMRQLQISKDGGALAITQYFASETTKPISLASATITGVQIDTDYPFSETVSIGVIGASHPFTLELRIPGWCKGATIALDGTTTSTSLQSGSMHPVLVPAGSHNIMLKLPMQIQIERRPPYLISVNETIHSNAVTVTRGPLVYALPLQYNLDTGKVYDDRTEDQPFGQVHGQNSYLRGEDDWRYALVVCDKGDNVNYLSHKIEATVASPKGQGIFAEALIPDRVLARMIPLTRQEWDFVQAGRGALTECVDNTTSQPGYKTGWIGLPPSSPVSVPDDRKAVQLELIPFGATNLRVAEFATTCPSETEYMF